MRISDWSSDVCSSDLGTSSEADPKLRNEANANFHFRMVEVAMMLLLPMAALAFAIPPKRSTSALGVFLSIVFIVTYHKINEYAESLGADRKSTRLNSSH